MDGNGELELNIGYAGDVGVQNVSFEGKRLWFNRSLDNVISLAVLDPDAEGHRKLWCANERPLIAVMNFAGKSEPDIPVPNRGVDVLVTAHLDNPDQLDVAGEGFAEAGGTVGHRHRPPGARIVELSATCRAATPRCTVLIAGRVLPEGPANGC